MLSKASEYAIRAMVYLYTTSGVNKRCGVEEVADAINSPKSFTAKILQRLKNSGFISSLKGPTGGFFIEDKEKEVKLIEVILAIEGNSIFEKCGLGLQNCNSEHPCPLHDDYLSVRDGFKDLVSRRSVKELAGKLQRGDAYVKRPLID